MDNLMVPEKTIPDDFSDADAHLNYHVPVLLNACIAGLNIKKDGVYVDCTFGGGGHSRAILNELGSEGKLIVFDQDAAALQNVPSDPRIVFVQQNFKHLKKFLRLHKHPQVDGILADLGVSSHQFDEAERGFSIRFDAALDMRMDHRQSITAATILEKYSELQLQKMFEQYGEVTNAKTLAKTIVAKRAIAPIQRIGQFKQAIHEVVMGNPNKYLAKVFQALRITVNDEIGALQFLLEQCVESVKPGGRIAIITFHSLEDRVVKNFFKTGSLQDIPADDVYGTRVESPLKIISKKPIEADAAELKLNSRSRSAKLRIAEKK
jgi:16S rRNA (cytosine1402-N4)-methyltransferase